MTIGQLVPKAMAGDQSALAELFDYYRDRLKRMVIIRMDPRLRNRLDASDILQEAYIELSRRLPEYARQQKLPFFLWLRMMTGQRLTLAHREHLGAAKRNAAREVHLVDGRMPEASTVYLTEQLMATISSPSEQVVRQELQAKVQDLLDSMELHDREILVLRHFEEMTIRECALALELTETAASSRYIRALRRIHKILDHRGDA